MISNGVYKANSLYDPLFEWFGFPTGHAETIDKDELFTIEYVEKNDPLRDYYKITFKSGVVTGRIGKGYNMLERVIKVEDIEEEEVVC